MEHTEREIDEQMFVKGEKRKEKRRQEKRGGVFWLAGGGGDYERSEYSQQASQPYAFEINL